MDVSNIQIHFVLGRC